MNSCILSRGSLQALIPFASPLRLALEEYLALPQTENMCGIVSPSNTGQSCTLKVEVGLPYLGL